MREKVFVKEKKDKHRGELCEVAERFWKLGNEVVHEVQCVQRREIAKAVRKRRECVEEPRAVAS